MAEALKEAQADVDYATRENVYRIVSEAKGDVFKWVVGLALAQISLLRRGAHQAPMTMRHPHDGFSDLAVRVPRDLHFRDFAGTEGAVSVIRGSITGLRSTGNQIWGTPN